MNPSRSCFGDLSRTGTMLSLPHQDAQDSSVCWKPCESRGFSLWLVGITTIPHPEWAAGTVTADLFWMGPSLSLRVYVPHDSAEYLSRTSAVSTCVLRTLAALVSLDFWLYHNSWLHLGSTWVSLPCSVAALLVQYAGEVRGPTLFVSCLRNHCHLYLMSWKTTVSYILPILVISGRVNPVPASLSCQEAELSSFVYSRTKKKGTMDRIVVRRNWVGDL